MSISPLFRLLAAASCILLLSACGGATSEAEYLARAQSSTEQGEYNAAIIDLKNILKENPTHAEARYLLGESYIAVGDSLAAEKELLQAQTLGISADKVTPALSTAQLQSRQLEKLEALDVGLVNDDKRRAHVLANKALGVLNVGDVGKASLYSAAALDLAPNNLMVIVANAQVAAAGLEEDYALAELDRAFAIDPDYAPAWSLLGDLYHSQKELVKAEEAYSKAIDSSIVHADQLFRRAQVRVALARYEAAQEDLDKLKSGFSKASNFNYLQGLVFLETGSLVAARGAFEAAVVANTKNPLALYQLAAAQFSLDELQQAQSHASQFLSVAPESRRGQLLMAQIYLKQQNLIEARKLLAPLIDDTFYSLTAKQLLAGVELRAGNARKAASLLAELVSAIPDSATLRVQSGIALIQADNADAAIKELKTALQIDSSLESAYTALTRALMGLQRRDEAKAAVADYLENFPSSAAAQYLAGEIYENSGNETQAIKYFEAAIKLEPSQPQANHALAKYATANKDYTTARARLKAVLEADKNHLKTLMNLAALEALVGDREAFKELLQQASAAHPHQAQPQIVLGRYYIATGQPSEVPYLMAQLDRTSKSSAPVLEVLAMASIAQNNFADAELLLERLLDGKAPSAQGYYLMALAQAGLNDTERMEENLKRSINLNPKLRDSWLALASHQVGSGKLEAAKESVQELKDLGANKDRILRLEAAIAAGGGDYQLQNDLLEQLSSEVINSKDVLNMVTAKLASGDEAGAIQLQRDWLAKNEGDYINALALANRLVARGDSAGAVAVYESSLKQNPNNFLVLNEIAWTLLATEPKRALQYSKRSVELAAEVPAVLDTYAMVLAANKQLDLARRTIDQVLAKTDRQSFKYHSALIYLQQKQKDAAIQQLTNLLQDPAAFEERQSAVELLASLQ
ncbi:XrtA/PEP-CTERM system TPR-repeat protein PrsT [Candidatus Litorirhabdus singularis]|uniref:XrtA/PEP-CTERM system TPR-repeat protein PrsT n=1 Tax=Candidatus Litorirhabdus singularis TaxID=2518993 RepID=UPI00242F3BD6|nr:XrtA/PEP-CTERM system TPR-repeat protein PrsT [Candidatus Litorirhabdus singularis]